MTERRQSRAIKVGGVTVGGGATDSGEWAWADASTKASVTVTYSDGDTRRIDNYQLMSKYQTRNIHLLRRQMVYLRMAEALNMGGFPRMAFQILSTGLNTEVMTKYVYPTISKEDSLQVLSLGLRFSTDYRLFTERHMAGTTTESANTMGIHTRGSGYTPMNAYYQLVDSVPRTVSGYTSMTAPSVIPPYMILCLWQSSRPSWTA